MSRADRFTASPRQTNVRRIAWPYVPLRSRPWVMPIWISRRGGRALQVAQFERRRGGARGIVLVGERRPEHAVQVRALVAEGQLEDVAAVAGHDLLRPDDEGVELDDRRRHRRRSRCRRSAGRAGRPAGARPGTRRGRSAAARRRRAAATGGRVDSASGRRLRRRGRSATSTVERSTTPNAPARRRVVARVSASSTRSPRASSADRVEDDLALLGVVLGLGEVVDQAAGQDVDELDLRDRRRRTGAPAPTAIATFMASVNGACRRAS